MEKLQEIITNGFMLMNDGQDMEMMPEWVYIALVVLILGACFIAVLKKNKDKK